MEDAAERADNQMSDNEDCGGHVTRDARKIR